MLDEFNLVDQPFLPCRDLAGNQILLPLAEIWPQSPHLRGLDAPSPTQNAALLLFLLAMLLSAFGEETNAESRRRWQRAGKFPEKEIRDYLDRVRERLDLFDPEYPFLQFPGLEKYFVGIQKLFPERASGNNDTLFDHTLEKSNLSVPPSSAAVALITAQAFSVGGLVSFEKSEDRSAPAARLASAMLVHVNGDSLFETLLLNLPRYDSAEPFPIRDGDLPAWERADLTTTRERIPNGLRDYLTFQSRRILLGRRVLDNSAVVCDRVAILKGEQIDPTWAYRDRDPFVPYRRYASKQSGTIWLPMKLDPARAAWRDSAAIFTPRDQSTDAYTRRPYHFSWLETLVDDSEVGIKNLDLTVIGQVTDQANILLWREETLKLPALLLTDTAYTNCLQQRLRYAESNGRALASAVSTALEAMGCSNKNTPHLDQALTIYWSSLEPEYRKLISALSAATRDEDGQLETDTLANSWGKSVKFLAIQAFRQFANGLGRDARSLLARVQAEQQLTRRRNSEEGEAA